MKRKVLLIPLIIFLAIAAALLWQLARNAEGDDPTNLESALIGKPETVLYAEKRYYNTAGSMMTEAAIDGGITRDLYAALGEELENGAWAVRLYYKPFVRWIWAGGLMMALGGLLCLFDPRYRKRVNPQKTAPEAV